MQPNTPEDGHIDARKLLHQVGISRQFHNFNIDCFCLYNGIILHDDA